MTTKIAVLSSHDSAYDDIATITVPNKQEYCDLYAYQLHIDRCETETDETRRIQSRDILAHRKLLYIAEMLEADNDWLVWIDADALILNYNIQLEQFIKTGYDFIIGEDWNGINAGVFFLRVCDKSKAFIDSCIGYEPDLLYQKQTPWWWWPSEQCAMLMNSHMLNTKKVHHSLFNAYLNGPVCENDWRMHGLGPSDPTFTPKPFQHNDFILHLVDIARDSRAVVADRCIKTFLVR